jgi:hypothetical protein
MGHLAPHSRAQDMKLSFAPWSQNLRKHGDSQTQVQIAFLLMGIAFWVMAKSTDEPIMSSRAYGDLIGSYPAELWAASVMLASAVYLAGIIINGIWRGSAILRLIGALWHVITLSLFAWGGFHAPEGKHLFAWSAVALFLHGRFLIWNLGDFARAIRVRDAD